MVKSAVLDPVNGLGFDAVETGQSKEISNRVVASTWCALVTGTFVGTVVVEGSNDGSNWAPMAAGLTAPGIVSSAAAVKMVRARCSAYTSGAAFCSVAYDTNDK